MNRSLRLLVVAGWALRLFHYLLDPSVWHDEAALIVNVLRYDFARLLGPLMWNEAAPPLFLWLERSLVLLLGDGTLALRLASLLASCLTLPLFARAAERTLPPRGAVVAVLLMAVSDRLLWHAAEAKPYSIDVLIATLALCSYSASTLTRRLITLTIVSPIAIWLSYPACFLCGGLWLALLPEMVHGRGRERGLFLLWSLAFGGAFLTLYFGPAQAQRTGPMEGCWLHHFPDWSRPWSLPGWTIIQTLEVLRYNFRPVGFLFAGLILVGIVAERKRPTWLTLLVAPLALAWLAACVRGYPYGGSRLELFATPALALLIGAGVEPTRAWFAHRYLKWGHALTVILLLIPTSWAALHLVMPWPRADIAGASRFIRENRRPDEPVAANHWEYAYYFRDLPEQLRLGEELPSVPRVWIAFTAPDPQLRREAEEHVARQGRIVQRREFTWTIVLLLERETSEMVQR